LEVFLKYSRSEDSLQEGQRDKSVARVSSFKIVTNKSIENLT
jgi:hypothetical protein